MFTGFRRPCGLSGRNCRFPGLMTLSQESRAFVGMLAYYELTGKEEYLAAVEKAMALTMREYGPHRSYFALPKPAGGTCHGLMMVDACEWLYRMTGKEAYDV